MSEGRWATWGKGSKEGGNGGPGWSWIHTLRPPCTRRSRTNRLCCWLRVFSHWQPLHVQGPKYPWQLAGWVLKGHFLVCLPASFPQAATPWQRGAEKRAQKPLPCHSTPRSLLFIPGSLSFCGAVQLAASLARLSHTPSVKCQSSHQMSSSASHPQWLCPRKRAAIAETQQRGVGLLALPLIVFRLRMGVKMEFEGIALCLLLSGQPQGWATLR